MSIKQCIVVADRSRARLFSVEDTRETPFEQGRRRLKEQRDLVSPEAKLTDQEAYSDRGGRRNRSTVTGGGYGFDDGKDGHREEVARRFAKELAAAAFEFVRSRKSDELVLVVSPRFLGFVREEVRGMLPKGVELTELAEDLSWHAAAQIEKVLARRGVFGVSRLNASG